MEQKHNHPRSMLVALCLIIISPFALIMAGSAYTILTTPRFSNRPVFAALDAAQQRWNDSRTEHYMLKVHMSNHDPGFWELTCSYRVEVRAERIVGTSANSCAFAPMSVTELFGWMRGYLRTFDGQCGPNGCKCDGPISMEALYDPQRGYPLRAAYRTLDGYGWQYEDKPWYQMLLGVQKSCMMMGWRAAKIYEVVVTPLAP